LSIFFIYYIGLNHKNFQWQILGIQTDIQLLLWFEFKWPPIKQINFWSLGDWHLCGGLSTLGPLWLLFMDRRFPQGWLQVNINYYEYGYHW
jgi:hypothetical protein